MKKVTLSLVFAFSVLFGLNAQLVNNGGTITIEANATLIVEGNVSHNSGSIVNNGVLQVEGNMVNDGTYTAGTGSKLIMSGTTSGDLDMNGATVAILENSKTSGDVNVLSEVRVSESVDFSGTSDIILGDFNVVLEESTTTNGDTDGHFVTDGLGTVNKELSAAGTYTADVGDGTNYTPIEYVHSGTYSGSTINTGVTNMKHPEITGAYGDADDYLNRYWQTTTSITSPTLQMTGTYVAGDVNGVDTDMTGARWETTDWEFETGAQSGLTVSATTTNTTSELTGMNLYGKTNVKVMLDGPYDDLTQTMSTDLNDLDIIPNNTPYTDGKSVDAAFWNDANNDDIVDWIFIETRDAGGAVTGGSSAFLESDGDIVSIDGSSLPAIKDAGANGYIVIKHRNHAPIATANTVSMSDEALHDLSSTAVSVFGSNTRKLYAGNSIATMWAGDAFGDESVKLLGANNDATEIRNAILDEPANFFNSLTFVIQDTYSALDTNMDGDIKFLGSNNDNLIVRNSILDHPGNFFNSFTYTILNSLP